MVTPSLHVRVISLPSSTSRRAHATRQLRDLGIPFEIFPAVERTSAMSHFTAVCSRDFLSQTGRVPTLGEIGCFASHRALWRYCADSRQPIVILEDDFLAGPDLPHALDAVGSCIQELRFVRLQEENRGIGSFTTKIGRYELWRFEKAPHGAMAYGLSPDAAKKLLMHSAEVRAPVDVFLKQFWVHGVIPYGLRPYPIRESKLASPSTIGVRESANKTLAQQLRRSLYRVYSAVARRRYSQLCAKKFSAGSINHIDRDRLFARASSNQSKPIE